MFKEMNYVYAVYEAKSFTKAAQKLYISQPALSSMVKKAEKKIGMPIFDRSTTPITLTRAGRYYIQQTEVIMHIQKEAEEHFRRLAGTHANQLRLGGSSFFLSYVFPPVVKRFRQSNKQANVSWVESRNDELITRLMKNDIDFFLEVDELANESIGAWLWGEEQLILAVPAEWPINDQLLDYQLSAEDVHERKHRSDEVPAVDVSVFAEEPFILLREGNDSHRRAVGICRNAGFRPQNIYMTADQMLTSYYLAAEGHGAAFIRDSILFHADLTENLYFYRLDDPLATRNIYLYYRRDKELSPVAQSFLDFVRSHPAISI